MTLNLTQRRMTPVRGQAAFLPNQPILHNCVVSSNQETPLYPGDVVTFDTTSTLDGLIVVKKAAATDLPIGVVVYQAIQSAFGGQQVGAINQGERVSIFDTNSYVYMEAGAADLTAGTVVTANAEGQLVAATAGQGAIGVVYTAVEAVDDYIVLKVTPSTIPAAE